MYRQEEGLWARVPAALIGGVITVVAASAASGTGTTVLGVIGAALVFVVLGAATLYLTLFHRKTGDVLIDTESEMRKVVWPTRVEVQGSATVVIITSLLLGCLIYVTDIVLTQLLVASGLY